MAGKRRYGGTSYSRPKRRTSGYRKKVGYRKYVRKASSTVYQRKPARFAYSRTANRLNVAVARSIRGMAESKVIALREQEWIQPQAVLGGGAISSVKWVTGQTPVTSMSGYNPVGGFLANQGDGKANRDGQFIWLKGTTANLTIQMDHTAVSGRPGPTSFRVMVFKAKRALNPSGTSLEPGSSLFLTNAGDNIGDGVSGANAMGPMDMMLQPVNTNNWYTICDKKFNLAHTQTVPGENEGLRRNMPSYKNIRLSLKHQTKARYDLGSNEPTDYNYRFAIAIYAFYPNQSPTITADLPLGWSASLRGTTTFNDV